MIVLDNPQSIRDLQSYLKDKDLIAFDTETTGLTKYDEIIGFSVCAEENLAYYVILSKYDKEANKLQTILGNKEASYDLINSILDKNLVMHNGVFDCAMVEAFFKISIINSLHTCTMVLAHLLDENRRVGLKELGTIFFGEDSTEEQKEMKESVLANGGKLTKAEYEMFKADAYLMGKYGAKDALLTFMLFPILFLELHEQGLDKFFYEDETMPLLKGSTYDLNTTGIQIDLKALTSLKKSLQAECAEAKSFVYNEIDLLIKHKYPGTTKKNVFNIGSSSQLSWLLFGELNLEFSTLTKEGKNVCKFLINKLPYKISDKNNFIKECNVQVGGLYQPAGFKAGKKTNAKKIKEPWAYIACDKSTLKKYSTKFKWIERLLEYQRKTKMLSTYVEGIESRVKYGIIQPNFLQHGTTSGRYSSRNPNFQNLPRDDQRIKACVIARPGKVFVGSDFSQLEPRTFAYTSQDPRLMEAFNGDDDFYSVIGMGVYNKTDCTPKKEGSPEAFGVKYKKLRDLSKVIALASTYGASASQLAPTTGKSKDDTQADIDNYFERFPGVAKMMTDSHDQAKANGYVTNLFGRPRRIPEAKKINKIYGDKLHAEYPYEVRSLLNLAVNHRIQSTAASIVNRAAIQFHKDCKAAGLEVKLVCQIHDELIAECRQEDAENVALLLQNAMETTTLLPGVPLEAIPRITKTLAK